MPEGLGLGLVVKPSALVSIAVILFHLSPITYGATHGVQRDKITPLNSNDWINFSHVPLVCSFLYGVPLTLPCALSHLLSSILPNESG